MIYPIASALPDGTVEALVAIAGAIWFLGQFVGKKNAPDAAAAVTQAQTEAMRSEIRALAAESRESAKEARVETNEIGKKVDRLVTDVALLVQRQDQQENAVQKLQVKLSSPNLPASDPRREPDPPRHPTGRHSTVKP